MSLAEFWDTFWVFIVVPGIFIGYGVIRAVIDEFNPNSPIRRERREWARLEEKWRNQ